MADVPAVLCTLSDLHAQLVTSDEEADLLWTAFVQSVRRVECTKDALNGFVANDAHFEADIIVLQATQRALQAQLETLSAQVSDLHRAHAACQTMHRDFVSRANDILAFAVTSALARRPAEERGMEGHFMFAGPRVDLSNPAFGDSVNNVRDDGPLNERIGTTFG